MRVARRRHRLGTERHRRRRSGEPRLQDTNPPKKDGRRRCGACEGCVHGGKCQIIQAKWKRIKEQKEEERKRRRKERGGGSSSEASENEGPDDPEEVAAAEMDHANAGALCAAGLPGLAHFRGVVCSIELRNQRAGIIERTRIMKRKLLRDFAIDFGHIGGRIGGENEKATIKVESSPASSSIKADDEPLERPRERGDRGGTHENLEVRGRGLPHRIGLRRTRAEWTNGHC